MNSKMKPTFVPCEIHTRKRSKAKHRHSCLEKSKEGQKQNVRHTTYYVFKTYYLY